MTDTKDRAAAPDIKLFMKHDHDGVSRCRALSAKKLAELTNPLIIHDRATPVAALVPYNLYMAVQAVILGDRK